MESEIRIDEEYLKNRASSALEMVNYVNQEVKKMIDDKEDIFIRYMSHAKLEAIMPAVITALEIFRQTFYSGSNVSHPLICSDKAKDYDWDKQILEDDPFFTTEEQEKMEKFRRMIEVPVLGVIKQGVRKKNDEDIP